MPSSSSQMLQGFHVRFLHLVPAISSKIQLFSPRNYLIKRILKKHALQPVSNVPRWLLAGSRPRFVNITLRTQNLQRQSFKQRFCGFNREVRRVIGKRPDLIRHAHCSPARMRRSRNRVHRMMNIHREIQHASRNEDARELAYDSSRRFRMVHHVVTNHDVETPIAKRQRFTHRSNCRSTSLPARKETSITNSERINSDPMCRTEVEDQPVRAAADFNHTRIRLDRLKRLESVTHASRRLNHRGDDLFFAPPQVFRLAFLVSKLARQGPLRKPMTSLFSETHLLLCYVLLCFFVAKTAVL